MNESRLATLQRFMTEHKTTQVLVTDPAAIFYLTGHWFSPGERLIALIVPASGQPLLLNNELFPLPGDLTMPVEWYQDTDDITARLSGLLQGKTIAVDKTLPARFLLPLLQKEPKRRFILASPMVDGARLRKDEAEQDRMRRASRLNDEAMTRLLETVTPGCSETELAARLTGIYQELGADGVSFPPIIAFGPNGADPHHESDGSRLKSGDTIILDIGCRKDDYCSDMTRTVFFQKVSEGGRRVYDIVRQANLKAIAAVSPGARFSDVDRAARDHIAALGYGPYFTHRTGHGIGIEIHEPEDVSGVNDHLLEPGMIFSIEPGIYLPGKLGIRIEDLVLVTETGCEVLNSVSKDLLVLNPQD